jgi:hypothetical protein
VATVLTPADTIRRDEYCASVTGLPGTLAWEVLRMRSHVPFARCLAIFVLGLWIWLILPSEALATALVRWVHAVPGVGSGTIGVTTAGGEQQFGTIGFGEVTPFKSIPSGSFRWALTRSGTVLASGTSTVGDGVYDIAVIQKMPGSGVTLGIYRAATADHGVSLVRVIHAAPELGSPMFMLDNGTVAHSLPYGGATRYFAIPPGAYTFSAMKPWLMKPGDPTLVDLKGRKYVSGSAYSEIVLGSRGQMVRVVRLVDRGAPLTRPAVFAKLDKPGMKSGSSPMVVRPGDSLWSIARHACGPKATPTEVQKMLDLIWRANKPRIGTNDPNVIFAGQRLMVPPVPKAR